MYLFKPFQLGQKSAAVSGLLSMLSHKLAAGTGVLRTNTSDTSDNADLEAVEEILSQHSNPTSCAGTVASKADSPAISIPNPSLSSAIYSNRHRHRLSANDCHALAPAGAYEQAASPVIDLSDSSMPANHANTVEQNTPHSHSGNLKADSLPEVEANISHTRPAMHLPEETSNRSAGRICSLGLKCCCFEHGMPFLQAQAVASACQHTIGIVRHTQHNLRLCTRQQPGGKASALPLHINTQHLAQHHNVPTNWALHHCCHDCLM